ncbi:zinc-dependent alcohol dehydrogenase family protein [Novosphingobium pentaromativorans]|uniref:Zinc-binding alcohol dehydrogenase n=1 Tax=Novosphingobium pentaromativorans US6-1 TaxID=1088721 RepID=G6E805_9SPHN|nr:NAD(P)-dependent alcohol dehydrogenase [Novosphingobium pentaromativorans]AIT81479.1 NADPH:quinone oxidoreductase [Novosphingobium pentaromativorans US6-1]EHJ62648.1 zinc-binding alcohol dehydrogenase [Novosphingobium pentaromativorans US6-1]
MRTIQLSSPGGLDRLHLVEAEPRAPGPGEIMVRVRASSLNYHDYIVVKGGVPTKDGRIPMSDGAGEVVEVGEGVDRFAAGDSVISTFFPRWKDGEPDSYAISEVPGDRGIDGFASEFVTASADGFSHAPKGYSHMEAATLTCAGLTAWRALMVNGGLKPGDTVLTMGTGGVSIFALQFAKLAGATVISTSSSDDKLKRLQEMGADHIINYRKFPEWGQMAKELTDGRGVDHVVEIGGSGSLAQSVEACRHGGHIAMIGVLASRDEKPTPAGMPSPMVKVMMKQIRLCGLTVGARRHQEDMIRAIEANGLRPVLDRSFALEALADAFRYQETGSHFGKIGIEI